MERIEQIRQMLADAPEDLFLKHALALEYIKSEQDEKAQLLFEEILNTDPEYIGSYYHLGKLYERKRLGLRAGEIYEKGILMAMAAGDHHAAGELRSALEDLE